MTCEEALSPVYHSNSLGLGQQTSGIEMRCIPCTLGKQVVFAIDMDHAILEDTLPLVFNPCDLVYSQAMLIKISRNTNLIIGAEHDVGLIGASLVRFLLALSV